MKTRIYAAQAVKGLKQSPKGVYLSCATCSIRDDTGRVYHILANTMHSPNAVSMLVQRRRRLSNIETALFAGMSHWISPVNQR